MSVPSAAAKVPAAQQDAPQPAAAVAAAVAEEQHPFETDPGDHAETPFEAYGHLDLLLTRLAKRLGTTKAELRIYDPFFCEGRMVQHLNRLGFDSVYNRNEDFYAVKAAGTLPEYDVLVTNPPFSGDHIERILRFAVKSDKPWFLLVPQYVARKAFFLEWLNNKRPKGVPKPAYVAPTRSPYVFTAPNRADVREMRCQGQAEAAAHKSSGNADVAAAQASLSALNLNPTATDAAAAESAAAAAAAVSAPAAVAFDSEGSHPHTPTAAAAPGAAAAAAAAADLPAAKATDQPPAAAAAAEPAAGSPSVFAVPAGSFQCVWFFSLGERHHKPAIEWVQQQLAQQQLQQQGEVAGGAAAAAAPAYCVVTSPLEVPELMAAPKLTPAERRWRKKLAAAGGQLDEQRQQQQQLGEASGRAAGRQAGARQQQQGGSGTGRQGGRQQLGGRQQQQQQQQQNSAGRQSGRVADRQGGGRQQQQQRASASASRSGFDLLEAVDC